MWNLNDLRFILNLEKARNLLAPLLFLGEIAIGTSCMHACTISPYSLLGLMMCFFIGISITGKQKLTENFYLDLFMQGKFGID